MKEPLQISSPSISLVTITPDAEKIILYCARVSSDQSNESTGLIKYLIRHKHWSPFEMAHAVMEIRTSRAIATQILRHRSFSFQELSQRYTPVDSFEVYNVRRQAPNNRQSSIDDLSDDDKDWFIRAQRNLNDYAFDLYQEALDRGYSRESARFLLSLAASTKLYMAGTIRSWIHYIDLRTDEHTQLEHREIALTIKKILSEQLPIISDALSWEG